MKNKLFLFLSILSLVLLGQFNIGNADNGNIELLSNGTAKVEGFIFNSKIDTGSHVIESTYKSNLTYNIEDIWSFNDIDEKIVQLSEIYFRTEHNGIPDDIQYIHQYTRLIWQKNASYLFSHAGRYKMSYDGTWSFKISLCNIRTYSEIIDPYNAQVTFHNGTTAIIKDIYDKLRPSEELTMIEGFVNGGYHIPSHLPPCYYLISPKAVLNQEYPIGTVTKFTNIGACGKIINVIKVEKNESEYVSETDFNLRYWSYFFERETGLLVKYFKNDTNEDYITIEEFDPFILLINNEIETTSLSLIGESIMLVIFFYFWKRKRYNTN